MSDSKTQKILKMYQLILGTLAIYTDSCHVTDFYFHTIYGYKLSTAISKTYNEKHKVGECHCNN